jgi:predicted AlkP superfamily pyrophosphatase or phosphodiesterase
MLPRRSRVWKANSRWFATGAFLLALLGASLGQTARPTNAPAQQDKPYVLLISIDGFRWDYAERDHAANLLALGRSGVRAKALIPSFPSTTFPNHYTIVTGLYPEHHGLVDNSFWDLARNAEFRSSDSAASTNGGWWGGTPLWVLAERQGMRAASFFWPGSDADIQGTRPTYYY